MTSSLTSAGNRGKLFSRISLTVLAAALLAATPGFVTQAQAATAHKTHAADASDDDAAAPKASTKHHAADDGDDTLAKSSKATKAQTAAKKTVASKDSDDDAAPAKGHAKTTTKLAEVEDDVLGKSGHTAKGKASAKDDGDDAAPAKSSKAHATKLADADDDAPAKSTHASKGKAAAKDDSDDAAPAKSAKGHASKLADSDDDTPSKSSKTAKGHASKLADADDDTPVKGHAPKLRTADDEAVPAKGRKTTHLASNDDDDTPAKSARDKSVGGKSLKLRGADDGDDDSATTTKSRKGSKLASTDDDDSSAKGRKHAKADADTSDKAEVVATDYGVDFGAGTLYKKVHGKAIRITLKQARAAGDVPIYHRVHGKYVLAARHDRLDEADNAALKAAQQSMRIGYATGPKPLPAAKTAQPTGMTLASVTQALAKLPQSIFATAGAMLPGTTPAAAATPPQPAAPAAPALNAAPIPYASVATQSSNTHGVLSPQDVTFYQTAFSQVDGGDYAGAEATLQQVSDKSLVGYVEYHKLIGSYPASYEELTAWLSQYGDEPSAMKIWALAKRKKPAGAPDPAFPSLMGKPPADASDPDSVTTALSGAVTLGATTSLSAAPSTGFDAGAPKIDSNDSDLTPKSARSAYNNGQYEQAVTLARKIGDHWVAGLANWRLKRYDAAETEFKFVSTDPSRDAWSQSSGAYWAGRCAEKLSQADQAETYFKIAASFPFTFYGLLAEQRLGVTPAIALAKQGVAPTFAADERESLTASLTDDFTWTKSSAPAQRLSALVQLGRNNDAKAELQTAVQRAGDGTERDHWLALAAYDHITVNQVHASDRLFNAAIYPTPNIKLKSGYKVDRALLFAFARKESKFNASARSPAGAYGLLQLMPGTAALMENNPKFNEHPQMLYSPTVNMRVGQEVMQRLLDSKVVNGDLLRLIAAYNGGPGPVKDTATALNGDNDSLLFMESIPVAETRQYVEEVAANYWIYRQILGHSSKTLVQAASDAPSIDAASDE